MDMLTHSSSRLVCLSSDRWHTLTIILRNLLQQFYPRHQPPVPTHNYRSRTLAANLMPTDRTQPTATPALAGDDDGCTNCGELMVRLCIEWLTLPGSLCFSSCSPSCPETATVLQRGGSSMTAA